MSAPAGSYSRSTVLLLGAATLWPPLYLVSFFLIIFGVVASTASGQPPAFLHPGASGPPLAFVGLFAAHGCTMVVMLALVVFYAVDVFRSPHVPERQRVLWLLVLLLGGIVAMPIYWWLYLWAPTRAPPGPTA